jgi:hypothetical protein
MELIDYTQSFVHGQAPGNRVRFVVESRTRLTERESGRRWDYVVCASCKSEDTFGNAYLFYEDNYDFLPVFGPEHTVVFRSKAYVHEGYRTTYPVDELWDGPSYRPLAPEAITELRTNTEIREATHEGHLLIAQTEWHGVDSGLDAIVEYPVKTMNIRDEDDMYQVDTGPVAFADLSTRPARLVDTLHLAFVAYNRDGLAEFILEAPTPIVEHGTELTQVPHYSRRIQVPAKKRLFAIV